MGRPTGLCLGPPDGVGVLHDQEPEAKAPEDVVVGEGSPGRRGCTVAKRYTTLVALFLIPHPSIQNTSKYLYIYIYT